MKKLVVLLLFSSFVFGSTLDGWKAMAGESCRSDDVWYGAKLIYKYLRKNDYTPSIAGAFEDVNAMCQTNRESCKVPDVRVKEYRGLDKVYFGKYACWFRRDGGGYTHFYSDVLKCFVKVPDNCILENILFNIQ